jgi:mono/diheme cytochrome c family protein
VNGAIGRIAAVLAVLAIVASCEKLDRNMYDNPAFKPQEDPVRPMPLDSIPAKGRSPVPPMAEAARLVNPVKPDEAALGKGKELYGIYCAPCHGDSGKGDGPVGKKFVPVPADLRAQSPASQSPDGVLFVILGRGAGGMPAFRAELSALERWQVIAYVRTLR